MVEPEIKVEFAERPGRLAQTPLGDVEPSIAIDIVVRVQPKIPGSAPGETIVDSCLGPELKPGAGLRMSIRGIGPAVVDASALFKESAVFPGLLRKRLLHRAQEGDEPKEQFQFTIYD